MTVEELVVEVFFDANEKDINSFKKEFEDTTKTVMKYGALLVGSMLALTKGVGIHNEKIIELGNVYGESEADISRWGDVATKNNSSLEAVTSSFESLNKIIGDADLGVASEGLAYLGISARDSQGDLKTSSELMLEVSDSLKGFSNQKQVQILEKLGIDKSMLMTLRQGREGVEELLKASFGNNNEELQSIDDIGTELSVVINHLKTFAGVVVARMTPALMFLLEGFDSLVVQGREAIDFIIRWGKNISDAIEHTLGWKNLIMLLAGAFVFLKSKMLLAGAVQGLTMLMNPIGLVIAGIVGIIAVWDDFQTYLEGGESYFKNIYDWIMKIKEDIADLIPDSVSDFFSSIGSAILPSNTSDTKPSNNQTVTNNISIQANGTDDNKLAKNIKNEIDSSVSSGISNVGLGV